MNVYIHIYIYTHVYMQRGAWSSGPRAPRPGPWAANTSICHDTITTTTTTNDSNNDNKYYYYYYYY